MCQRPRVKQCSSASVQPTRCTAGVLVRTTAGEVNKPGARCSVCPPEAAVVTAHKQGCVMFFTAGASLLCNAVFALDTSGNFVILFSVHRSLCTIGRKGKQ